jgi:uncharacterized membrane protein
MDLGVVAHNSQAAVLGVLGSIVNLNGLGHYIHWHWIFISVANLIVIGLMVVTFVLAILVPFPKHRTKKGHDDG